MVNFERSSLDAFNDISSIDQYRRSLEEGFSEEEALQIINLRSRDNARTPFPWTGGRYGGFSETAPWLPMSREYPVNSAKNPGRGQEQHSGVLPLHDSVQTEGALEGLPGIRRHTSSGVQRTCNCL